MITRGLISELDAGIIEKALKKVLISFIGKINTFEIGVNEGNTSRGICDFFDNHNREHWHLGVDNLQDGVTPPPDIFNCFLNGDSVQKAGELFDEFFHFGFIDANHSYHRVIADYVAYAPKIMVGGYLAFHDTSPIIKTFKDYQFEGMRDDPNMYISVRKALTDIGLLRGKFPNWEKVYDDYDENDEAGGVTVFKKVK